jgi:hypothetical protein
MEFTDQEKTTARVIVADEHIRDLLQKVFTTNEETLTKELVSSKTNEELGEIVRANVLAEAKVLARWAKLLRAGATDVERKAQDIAPE